MKRILDLSSTELYRNERGANLSYTKKEKKRKENGCQAMPVLHILDGYQLIFNVYSNSPGTGINQNSTGTWSPKEAEVDIV